MIRYPKINSIYKRDKQGNFIYNQFSEEAFEYLFNNEWIGTEKIDGTNIRIHWNGSEAIIGGRTERSQIPKHLLKRLNEIVESIDFTSKFSSNDVTLFGEGYGVKIQKKGRYYIQDGVDFILFDIKIDEWWMKRESVDEIAKALNIDSVPIRYRGNLQNAINMVKEGFESNIGVAHAEGLVLVPTTMLFNRKGERIIVKIKTKDFKKED